VDLAGTFSAPPLDRNEDEVGLLLERVWTTRLDCFEGSLGCTRDTAVGAGAGHDGNRFDYAEISIVVSPGGVIRVGRCGVTVASSTVAFIQGTLHDGYDIVFP
jgi:hypothetical protein